MGGRGLWDGGRRFVSPSKCPSSPKDGASGRYE